MFKTAKRLNLFSSAIFYELNHMKQELLHAGRTVTDLGIGSPDLFPPSHAIDAFSKALMQPGVFGYANTEGTSFFRDAAADFLRTRYQVDVDSTNEVLTLMGSQDALSHLTLALIDPGDIVLIPDPGYPIYEVAVHLAGGVPFYMPLSADTGFLPDLAAIPEDVAQRAKLMVLNFPGNPTTAQADGAFFRKLIEFAQQYEIMVVHDAAYIELMLNGHTAPSFLAENGAKEVGIELHSLSKTFNLAGPRLAFAAGNAQILQALRIIKSNIDYGVFLGAQMAGVAALRNPVEHITLMRATYLLRRDAFLAPLHEAGWKITPPESTMFV